jgi:hypothetical protein
MTSSFSLLVFPQSRKRHACYTKTYLRGRESSDNIVPTSHTKSAFDRGFNRSMQQIREIVELVSRNLVFSLVVR